MFEDCDTMSDVLARIECINEVSERDSQLIIDINRGYYIDSLLKEEISPTEDMIIDYHLWYFSRLPMGFKEFLEVFVYKKAREQK